MGKRRIKFLVDENLLGLLKKLRMFGIDSISLLGASDEIIHQTAIEQGRIVLTKDRRFFNKLSPDDAYFVSSALPKEQLLEVLSRFALENEEEPLSRCFICNSLIEKVGKETVKDKVDEKTFRLYEDFYQCPTCHRIYWEGSHFTKLQAEINQIKKEFFGS
ncbi:MAG: DUF5615 family PIN-like protein [Bdellovibrio sp.]